MDAQTFSMLEERISRQNDIFSHINKCMFIDRSSILTNVSGISVLKECFHDTKKYHPILSRVIIGLRQLAELWLKKMTGMDESYRIWHCNSAVSG